MIKRIFVISLVLMVSLPCCCVFADISPDEVLIVYNSAISESKQLAQYYGEFRRISQRNMIGLELSQEPEITYGEYIAKIRNPLRRVLWERRLERVVRCVCLIKGLPLRIAQDQQQMPKVDRNGISSQVRIDAYKRLQKAYKLLNVVGQDFSADPEARLEPLDTLFEKISNVNTNQKPRVLDRMFTTLLSRKEAQMNMLSQPLHRKIVQRQIMGLTLEVMGVDGLIAYMSLRMKNTQEFRIYSKESRKLENEFYKLNRCQSTNEVIQRRFEVIRRLYGVSRILSETKGFLLNFNKKKTPKIIPADLNCASLDNELVLLWNDVPAKKRAGAARNPLFKNLLKSTRKNKKPLMIGRIDGESYNGTRDMLEQVRAYKKGEGKLTISVDAKIFNPNNHKKQNSVLKKYFTHPRIDMKVDTKQGLDGLFKGGNLVNIFSVYEGIDFGWPEAEVFFDSFVENGLTLMESYWISQKYAGWMVSFSGDPLMKF